MSDSVFAFASGPSRAKPAPGSITRLTTSLRPPKKRKMENLEVARAG
jgi:hypothetical protein